VGCQGKNTHKSGFPFPGSAGWCCQIVCEEEIVDGIGGA